MFQKKKSLNYQVESFDWQNGFIRTCCQMPDILRY